MSRQLTFFDRRRSGPDPVAERLSRMHTEAAALAARLPAGVFFGTSSWSFPGWQGLVYSGGRSQASLAREGLREYARHPLLTTVGIDRSYYAPIPIPDLREHADQLPDGFRCCIKAPAAVTALALGAPGRQAPNPDFLSVDRLVGDLLEPCAAAFAGHTGPIILEFPPFPRAQSLEPADFLARLDRFLERLPRGFAYAVELRDARLLTAAYRRMLASTASRTPTTTGAPCPRPVSRRRSCRPTTCRSPWCACCCGRERGTRTSAIASSPSTGWWSQTPRCAPTSRPSRAAPCRAAARSSSW
ncbi:MAG: DUF72 domain-containing protein [Vicinamibacterales bacterium]